MTTHAIFGHRLRRVHGPSVSSPFATLLPRVRGMRDTGVWPPLTPHYTGHARGSRIAEARPGAHLLPPAYAPADHADRAAPTLRRWAICAIALLLSALTAAVVFVAIESQAPGRASSWDYTLPVAPPFLAENVAMAHALRALDDFGADSSLWVPVKAENAKRTRAPDGIPDAFFVRTGPNIGVIDFQRADSTNRLRTVILHLRGKDIWCSVR